MFKIFTMILQLATGIPSLVQAAEALWAHKPKSGPAKWIAVEQGASGLIQEIAQEVVNTVPNAKVDAVAAAAAKYTKASSDALVAFYNDVGWPTVVTPAVPAPAATTPAPAPAAATPTT
jgi:hypothetical protein